MNARSHQSVIGDKFTKFRYYPELTFHHLNEHLNEQMPYAGSQEHSFVVCKNAIE